MKRVVGLVAFCCVTLNLSTVSEVKAAKSYNQLRLEQLEKDSKIREYLNLLEKEGNRTQRGDFKNDSEDDDSGYESENPEIYDESHDQRGERVSNQNRMESDSSTSSATRKKRRKSNKNRSVQNVKSDNSTSSTTRKKRRKSNKNRSVQNVKEDSADLTMDESQNFNQNQKKKKRSSRKKNRSNQTNMMNQNNQINGYQNSGQNSKKKKNNKKKNQSYQTNMMNQNNQMNGYQNFENSSSAYNMSGNQMMNASQKSKKKKKKNNKKKNQSYQTNMMNQTRQNIGSSNGFVLNEPIIDDTKIKKSSIVVEKDIKLASNSEIKNSVKKINPVNSSQLDKEKGSDQVDSENGITLAANFDESDVKIKEKLLQINNSRKTYNLIRTPDKKFKENIQISKFREELDHYRKLYSTNLKKA